ncbi:MAG: putative hydrolase or acyltransferase [Gammaproteobacteria bacterium]|jgi:pimeloyl-ACP methyl ester carboxylesterase|nr:putative hydrolase or acyltransferase [Gammaproteobacteria bacterium]
MTARNLPLHFAHGNGFPSESYQELFDHLSPEFDIHYIPMVGHGEYPVTDNWPHLVAELIQHIKASHSQPVIGLGHSMGGVLMFMAAAQAPELFQQIILLDSPLPGFWRSFLLRFVKQMRLLHWFTPIQQVRVRRQSFHSKEEAFQYFKQKPLFRHFTDQSLWLYVENGLTATEKGYVLRFDRSIETNLYATVPHNLYQYSKPAGVRSSVIYSMHSHLLKSPELLAMRLRYGFELHAFDQGTHLFPFEYPKETAQKIKMITKELL